MSYRRAAALLLVSLLLLLVACERVWHFTISPGDDPLVPEFCISEKRGCRGAGVSLGVFFVYRIDEDTDEHITVWGISPSEDVPLHRLTYGKAPSGWKTTVEAQALEPGALYSVGKYHFRIHESGEGLRYEVLTKAGEAVDY
jgi:hypothetical protein